MKQLSIIILAVIAFSTNCMAQDRNNAAPAQLATKSKEIKSALYWQQDRKTGKWESRKNTTLVYLGEGVAVDNFNSLFIGEYAGRRYLFCDFKEYSWRYPVLQTEWIVSRMIMAALLSEADYSSMSNIEPGQVITITPRFYHKMFKGHAVISDKVHQPR